MSNDIDIFEFVNRAVREGIDQASNPKDDTEVIHQGTRVVLPAEPKPMTYRKGIKVLLAREAQVLACTGQEASHTHRRDAGELGKGCL